MLLVTSSMQSYADEMSEALHSGNVIRAITLCERVSSLRAARLIAEAPQETMIQLLTTIGWRRAGRIAAHFPPELAVSVMKELEQGDAVSLLEAMPIDGIVDVLRHMPEPMASQLLPRLDDEIRHQVERLAAYPEGSAGALMSPYYLAVASGTLIGEVIEAVRAEAPETEMTAYVFVLHPASGRLMGVSSLRELMMADRRAVIDDQMTSDVFAVRDIDDALEAAHRIRSRRLKLLPVVDDTDRLLGVIGMNQAMDLLTQELADDFVAINAASPDESFYTPPGEAIRKRLPWMAANVFLNLGAVVVIASFEEIIVQVAILAAFLPMITDMGGNVGIQALSVSIRSIALGEARLLDFWRAVRKEVLIGLVNGLALGALFCVVAYVMQGNLVLGIVAGFALGCNVLVAGVVGGSMPFLIKRIGRDPAMMTGPVLTTITDITGVTIYLGLCTLFLVSLLAGGAL